MEDATDLIDRLCTVAAVILEDIHYTALRHAESPSPSARIEAIRAAASYLTVLAKAAAIVEARFGT